MQLNQFNGFPGTDGDDFTVLRRASKLRRLDHGAVATVLMQHMSVGSADEVMQPRMVSDSSGDEEGPSRHGESESESGISIGDDDASDAELSDYELSDFSDDLSDDDDSIGSCSLGGFDMASITIDHVDEGACGVEAGKLVGDNDKLRRLVVDGEDMEWNPATEEGRRTQVWFLGLCRGICRNRSIRRLSLMGCGMDSLDVMSALSPFLEHNSNLRKLEIVGSNVAGCNLGDEGTRVLASSLSRRAEKASLRSVVLDANDIQDESGREIVNALRGYDNLGELSLGDNELGPATCEALANLLNESNSSLGGLNLENNQINDAGIAALSNALSQNSTLWDLNLSFSCGVSQAGWASFASCLASPSSALQALDLSSTNIEDVGARALGHALIQNKSLTSLDMYDITDDGKSLITSSGWRAIFACLEREDCKLERLDLRYGSVDEDGLSALSDALMHNESLATLDLGNNKLIPAEGWRSLFPVLSRPGSMLEEVRLRGSLLSDSEVEILTRCLRGNNGKLTTLDLGDSSAITKAGWAHFETLLCDASSATAIHTSNHALRSLGEPSIPSKLDELLLLNSRGDLKGVAREKLLRYRFSNGKENAHELGDMGAGALPHALGWAGRGGAAGRTLLFEALRSMPPLVANAGAERAIGCKRKRDP